MISTKNIFKLEGKRIWVAGHTGMVGSALLERLAKVNCDVITCTRKEVDLRRQIDVEKWISQNSPQVIFLAAATVGGILANDSRPAEFLYDNLAIETNIINGAWKSGVEKLLFLGSACVYPKHAQQPISEEALLTGSLEQTNEWYAVAKIAGIKMCQSYRRQYGCDFITIQPCNLYGPGDNLDLQSSHVIPALLYKAHVAKNKNLPSIELWGTGKPLRDFLYVKDFVEALIFIMEHYSQEDPINVGSGKEISIGELAVKICSVIGFEGDILFNSEMPDGMPRKILDSSRLEKLGWSATTPIENGLELTYEWFLRNKIAK